MAITPVSICNSGLIKIGVEPINSFSDTTKQAILCNEQYTKLRDEVLTAHPWNFAIKRTELGKLVAAPEFEYDNQFQLPNDCLRVLNINDDPYLQNDYAIEGKLLLSNVSSVKIRYISRIESSADFSPAFAEALATRISSELAYPMVQSLNLAKNMYEVYRNLIKQARSYDAQEGTPQGQVGDNWILSRVVSRGNQ